MLRGATFALCVWCGGWCAFLTVAALTIGATRLAQVAGLAAGILLGAALGIFATTHPEGG